jgi:SAM-dependent methyltransferase
VSTMSILLWVVAIAGGLFAAFLLFHYVLYLLMVNPRDASGIGRKLNEFERRQLVEWVQRPEDSLKHDNQNRGWDDVFRYRDPGMNYSTCVFPRTPFTSDYDAETILLELKDGMRLLDLGCGSGDAAADFATRKKVEVLCVTNSMAQTEICRKKFEEFGGRLKVMTTDFDTLDLPGESFDAIYAFETVGYSKDLDAWMARCMRMLKPGGRLLLRSPGGLDRCRREKDYRNVSAFFDNWRYNFLGANVLVYKLRRLGFEPIRYRQVPFLAWGVTWNYLGLMLLWKYRLKMQTFIDLERIIWRTSKVFVFSNPYNLVLAFKPAAAVTSAAAARVPQVAAGG